VAWCIRPIVAACARPVASLLRNAVARLMAGVAHLKVPLLAEVGVGANSEKAH